MKRPIASLRFASTSALATMVRMVCPRTSVASVALATTRILPSSISFRPNGGDAQPMSTWSVMTAVRAEEGLRLRLDVELVDEGADDAVRRGAVGGERDGVPVGGVLERFDRRGGLGVPVVRGAGRLSADDAHRRALGEGRDRAECANREAEIGA